MSEFGLILLLATAAGIVGTGLPAYLVLLAASCVASAAVWMTDPNSVALLTALPGRLVNLFENDLLQALPLYVFMGVLLDRLPLGEAIFRTFQAILPRRLYAPLVAGIGLGAVLGPMNGSVGASVVALSRSVGPRLAEAEIPPPTRHAVVAVASTLGVLVPPSLVVILLGDAMLTAHTIALDATHGTARAINTQDLFRGALLPAGLLIVLCLIVAWITGSAATSNASVKRFEPPNAREIAMAVASLTLLLVLLGGVALGYFYAVEAAAAGATALFFAGVCSGGLGLRALGNALAETLATTGALFAPLMAATSFTLVLRILGTDRLVADFISAIPGSPVSAVCVVLIVLGLSAFALDAFEIIFVVVPIVIPPVLVRAPDAVWVGVLVLFALQSSFILPPFGYALMMTGGRLGSDVALGELVRALAPFQLVQFLLLATIIVFPGIVHILEPKGNANRGNIQQFTPADTDQKMREMLKPPETLSTGPSFGAVRKN